jgi:hypothetical protein
MAGTKPGHDGNGQLYRPLVLDVESSSPSNSEKSQ